MNNDVIDLPVITKLDLNPDRVLNEAIGELDEVVVVGYTKEGDFYFSSSKADAGAVIYLFEYAKKLLLEVE